MNKKHMFYPPILFFGTLFVASYSFAQTPQDEMSRYALTTDNNIEVYQPLTQSRIRMYGKNGQKIYLQHSFDCAGKKDGIRNYLSSTGGWNAFKSYARWTFNQSKGMPRTAIQKEVEGNEMSTYAMLSYKEFILKANEPVNLYGFVVGAQNRTASKAQVITACEHAIGSFKPLAGHDYEVLGRYENNQCQFQVIDLKKNQQILISDQAYSCPVKSWKFWKKD